MKKVLIIVDVVEDFFYPNGSLPVKDGETIIPRINKLTRSGKFDMIIAVGEWHPENHISFASRYGLKPHTKLENGETVWPDHGVRGTHGAEFHKDLDQTYIQYIIRKGTDLEVDSYSAFKDNKKESETGLKALIDSLGEVDVHIVGTVQEICIENTGVDAISLFENVTVIYDACAQLDPKTGAESLNKLAGLGVETTYSTEDILND